MRERSLVNDCKEPSCRASCLLWEQKFLFLSPSFSLLFKHKIAFTTFRPKIEVCIFFYPCFGSAGLKRWETIVCTHFQEWVHLNGMIFQIWGFYFHRITNGLFLQTPQFFLWYKKWGMKDTFLHNRLESSLVPLSPDSGQFCLQLEQESLQASLMESPGGELRKDILPT